MKCKKCDGKGRLVHEEIRSMISETIYKVEE